MDIFKKTIAIISSVPAILASKIIFAAEGSDLIKNGINQMAEDSVVNIKEPSDIFNIIRTIVQWTYTIFFAVAIFFILLAAFNFLTSKGDPVKIKDARNQILWAVVAIAVALLSVGASSIIISLLPNK